MTCYKYLIFAPQIMGLQLPNDQKPKFKQKRKLFHNNRMQDQN